MADNFTNRAISYFNLFCEFEITQEIQPAEYDPIVHDKEEFNRFQSYFKQGLVDKLAGILEKLKTRKIYYNLPVDIFFIIECLKQDPSDDEAIIDGFVQSKSRLDNLSQRLT